MRHYFKPSLLPPSLQRRLDRWWFLTTVVAFNGGLKLPLKPISVVLNELLKLRYPQDEGEGEFLGEKPNPSHLGKHLAVLNREIQPDPTTREKITVSREHKKLPSRRRERGDRGDIGR